jgi:hypothetical protein
MERLLKIFFCFSAICFTTCGPSAEYVMYSRSADSLSGAVNAATIQLQSVDTLLIKKAITRYTYYFAFIEHTISDTLQKEEADQLLRFMSSGKHLQEFEHNRHLLFARGKLIGTQLSHLAEDARQQRTQPDVLKAYYKAESSEADKLLQLCHQQLSLCQTALSDFKSSLGAVETLIRQRNKGELPQVVLDSITF